ncbi:MAG TPA: elongation factor P [Thermoleophilia bacterium]|nr:elongation factor P [Thermoleophilia bacterium]
MISTNQFKTGMTIRHEGDIFRIVEFQHVKPGKGPAFVRTKLRNMDNGRVLDKTFRPELKFEQVHVETRTMQYLYDEPDTVVFMDQETFEQTHLPREMIEERFDLMKLNMEVDIVYMDGTPVDVELPFFVELQVTDAAPGVKGDTVSGGSKEAVLETGATIQVPLFVEPGDVIRVDTRTREYNTRV